MVHPDQPVLLVVVPIHPGKTLKKGTLRAIIRDARVTVEEFRDALK
jgi:predicted RNA binding protein YcfA (HicA-like mRNA interferase family)